MGVHILRRRRKTLTAETDIKLTELLGSEAFELNISHTSLRDKLGMTFPQQHRTGVYVILSDYALGHSTWTETAASLSEAGLSRTQIAQLAAIDLCSEPQSLAVLAVSD